MRKTLSAFALLLLLAMGVVVNSLKPSPSVKAREAVGQKVHIVKDHTDQSLYAKKYDIDYYLRGSGPLLVLAPSLGREASDFNEIVISLNKAGYSTATFDLTSQSFDKSITDENIMDISAPIVDFLNNDNVKPVVLIGHAFGNRVVRTAVKYQSSDSSNVNGVILLAAGGQIPISAGPQQSLRNIFNPLKTYRSRIKDINYAFFAEGSDIPEHWRRGWHRKAATAQAKAVSNTKKYWISKNMAKAFYEKNNWHCAGGVPMLIVQPMQDRIAPIENAYALKEKCPQEVQIVKVQNAGHALLPEQPEAVAAALLDFLAKHHPTDKNRYSPE